MINICEPQPSSAVYLIFSWLAFLALLSTLPPPPLCPLLNMSPLRVWSWLNSARGETDVGSSSCIVLHPSPRACLGAEGTLATACSNKIHNASVQNHVLWWGVCDIYYRASVCPTLCVLAREWALCCVTLHDCTHTHTHFYAFLEHSVWWNRLPPKKSGWEVWSDVFCRTSTHTYPPSHDLTNKIGTKQVGNYFIFLRFRPFSWFIFHLPSCGCFIEKEKAHWSRARPAVRDFEDTAGGSSQSKHLTFTSLIGRREKMKIEHPSILHPRGNWNA